MITRTVPVIYLEETFVERQTGPEYGSDDQFVVGQGDVERAEWRGDGLRTVVEGLRQLEGHHLSDGELRLCQRTRCQQTRREKCKILVHFGFIRQVLIILSRADLRAEPVNPP